jgi:hypothetical protein
LARARGESVEHPDPARAEAYLRLERALAGLELPKPREGWQAKVLAAIDREEAAGTGASKPVLPPARASGANAPPRPKAVPSSESASWRATLWPIAAVLALAALVLLFWKGQPSGGQSEPLALSFERSDVRGEPAPDQGAVGDTAVIEARLEGGEVRVYRDRRELVLRCPGDPSCSQIEEGGRRVLRAKLVLKAPGSYRIVSLGGGQVPPPSGLGEDEDLNKAAPFVIESKPFTVR